MYRDGQKNINIRIFQKLKVAIFELLNLIALIFKKIIYLVVLIYISENLTPKKGATNRDLREIDRSNCESKMSIETGMT